MLEILILIILVKDKLYLFIYFLIYYVINIDECIFLLIFKSCGIIKCMD